VVQLNTFKTVSPFQDVKIPVQILARMKEKTTRQIFEWCAHLASSLAWPLFSTLSILMPFIHVQKYLLC